MPPRSFGLGGASSPWEGDTPLSLKKKLKLVCGFSGRGERGLLFLPLLPPSSQTQRPSSPSKLVSAAACEYRYTMAPLQGPLHQKSAIFNFLAKGFADAGLSVSWAKTEIVPVCPTQKENTEGQIQTRGHVSFMPFLVRDQSLMFFLRMLGSSLSQGCNLKAWTPLGLALAVSLESR